MLKLVLATVLAAVVVGLPAKDGACKDSAAKFCMPVKSCNGGYIIKDPSTCCDVCVKSRERSVCGGIAYMFGKCDVGLICKVRHPSSIENEMLPAEAKIGKCEPAACKDIKCGMHQWCTVENNVPKCDCFINCNDKEETPVCGMKDGNNYKNRCMVRKLECKLQKQIGHLPGTCKKCLFNGYMYKFGEAVKGGEQCEKCTCRHGDWKCKFDVDCLKREFYQGYDCTGYTNLHNVIACPDGYKCKYETTKESISGIPALGKCIPLDAATACIHRPENGPCYGYFKVWYYDSTSKRCKPFIYGGCDGNDNRFQTQASCNKVCENVTTPDIPTIPVAPKVPVVPKAPDVPDVPKVPAVPDVPKAPAVPDVPKTQDIPKIPDVPEVEKNVHNKRSNITHVANIQAVVKPLVKECKIDGKRYKIGEKFVNKGCSGYCTCTSSQGYSCVSLCPPHGIICPIGTKKVTYDKPVLGTTRCTCPAYKCVPKDGCFYKGKHYQVLSTFVSQDCTEQCLCQEDGSPFCMPLCSAVAGFAKQGPCPVHQKMAQMNFTLPGEPRCSCPIPICYNDNEICSMESDSGPCFGYFKRWFFNKKSGKCEEFSYGGCKGNDNRFFSKKQCMSQCLSQEKITAPTFKIIDNKKDSVQLKPEFGTEDIKIYGRVVFGKFPGKLPSLSCLQVTLEDVSLQDDSSILYKREQFNVSDLNMNKHFLYSITSKKPKNAHEFYSVSAVLNIGWCSNMTSKSWIRDLDYLSDTAVYVPFEEGKTQYEIDVPVAFYCRGPACEKKSEPKTVDKNSKTTLTGPEEPKLTEKSDLEPPPVVTIEGKETPKMNVSEGKPPPKANLDEGMPQSLEMCSFLGKKYKIGTEFISADCKGRCICTGTKEISCVPSCPLVNIVCPPGMVKAGYEAPVANNSPCTCLREKCVPDEEAFVKPGPEFPEEAFEKPGPVFPDGPAARPIYGSEKMKIRGKVTFERIPGKLPSPSCLKVSFEDVALQDVSSVVYARNMIDVSNVTMGSEYKFELNTKKPLNLHDFYSVSATLNVGWCPVPDSDSWVRHNDYLTDTTYYIKMKKDVNEYETTMPLKFYCKGLCNSNIKAEKQLPKKSIEPPKVKELEPPKISEELETLELPGPMFPDGSSPDPQYGNGTLKIRGKLSFERNPGKLPFPSCLSISLQDASLQDVAAIVYKEDLIDVSNVSIASEYNFELVSKKPLMAHGGFSVSATLNVGWCRSPDSKRWIKPGDYLTDTGYYINMKDELDEYKTVMKMKFYTEKKIGTQQPLPEVKVPQMDSVIEQDILKKIEDIGEKEKDSESGFGYVKYPVYGDGNITIEGKVNFSSVPGKMPSPSCLTIDFKDISFQDVASILYEEEEYDVSGSEIGNVFKYKMETRRPKSSLRKFSVSAVLNVGWCPDKDSKFWIRNMDFLSVSTVNVPIDNDQTRYEVDIPAVLYCRGKNCKNTKSTNGSDVKLELQKKIAGGLKSVEKTAKKDQSISGKTHKDAKVHVLPPAGAIKIGNKEPKKLPKMPVCKDYTSGKEHYPGDEWWGDDDCMHCTCSSEGGTACATPMCALPFCQTGPAIKVKGRCCPVCPEDVLCKENGRTKVAVKERWQRDDCTVCQCTKDGVVCIDSGLKKQSCNKPVRWNENCEPICADDIMPLIPPPSPKGCIKQDGSFASFLSTWKVDNCTSCSCTKSHGVKCSSPVCEFDNFNCDKLEKVKGECCPKCIRKKCIYKYGSYSENEIIVKSDRLTVCRCSNGDWVCDGKKEKTTCKDETGLVFQLGQIRKPDCNTCICAEGGNWACTIMSCPTESKSSEEAMP